MRVLIIMPSIPLQGMERSTLAIAKVLKDGGAEVLMVLEDTWANAVHAAAGALGVGIRKIPFAAAPGLTLNPLRALRMWRDWRRTARRLGAIEREFQPTHIHVTSLTFFLLALPVLRRSQACVVFRLPNPPDSVLRGARRAISRWLWRRHVLPNCDRIVCNSEYAARLVSALRSGAEAPRVIRNMLVPASAAKHDALRLAQDRFNVVYLGRIRPEKGVDVLLRAALRLVETHADIDFHLAGEKAWRNPFAAAWERELARRGLNGRIRLLGEFDDAPALVAQAQVHVCPSVSANESFPNVVLEAKSRAVASVVFPVAGLPEAVEHRRTGFVCHGTSVEDLIEGILYFHERRERCRELGAAALASLERYDERAIGSQWLALYRDCRRTRRNA